MFPFPLSVIGRLSGSYYETTVDNFPLIRLTWAITEIYERFMSVTYRRGETTQNVRTVKIKLKYLII